jgi:ligand-binding sensor domain-containing protein/signal transduction histidine kinase
MNSRILMDQEGLRFTAGLPLILILVFTLQALALDPNREITQYVHDVWQDKEGLPQNSVQAILQDHRGYLWLGTQEGLVRFDGVQFKTYDKWNTPGLRHNNVLSLFEDRTGCLWVGTFDGVHKLKEGRVLPFRGENQLVGRLVRAIAEDQKGDIWIATDKGLWKISETNMEVFTVKNGISNDSVNALRLDHNANLWIGTQTALDCMKGTKITRYLEQNVIRAIYEDKEDHLWVGTENGLFESRGNQFLLRTVGDISPNRIWALTGDRDGNLWIGTYGKGLKRLHAGSITSFLPKDGLTSEIVWAIYEDREGSVWLGTYGGGLDRLKEGSAITFGRTEGLRDDGVSSIYEDRERNVWIGTAKGVTRLKDGIMADYGNKEGFTETYVLSIAEDSKNNLWFGTEDKGLFLFRNGRFTQFTTRDGLAGDDIDCITPYSSGELWIGTFGGGASLWQNGRFTNLTTKEGLGHNIVHAILRDHLGNLWFATNGGITERHQGRMQTFTMKDGLSNNITLALHEDTAGDLWIGTYGGGLNLYKNGKFYSFTKGEGLFDDSIAQILEDGKGNLWMSSNRGIFYVSKAELLAISAGKNSRIHSFAFSEKDGMRSVECNGGSQPAGWRAADGRLWFPTLKGAVVIDAEHLPLNRHIPPVVIEEIHVNNSLLSNNPSESITVAPGAERLEILYTALSYLNPNRMQFQYMLEGFDKTWNPAVKRRTAYYTNVPPGRYTFRVKGSNNDGIWNEEGAILNIQLQPYFYQTRWFYLALALGMIALLWLLYRYRLQIIRRRIEQRLLAVVDERTRIAREIHDTVAQGLASIAVLSEACRLMVGGTPEVLQRQMTEVRDLANNTTAEARRLIQNLRPRQLEGSDLPSAIEKVRKQAIIDHQQEVTFNISGAVYPLPEILENELFRIFQEALTNAVKHSRASRIDIELKFLRSAISLLIRDDGCGTNFNTQQSQTTERFGLQGMRERAESLGGNVILQSVAGSGTELIVTVPTK